MNQSFEKRVEAEFDYPAWVKLIRAQILEMTGPAKTELATYLLSTSSLDADKRAWVERIVGL